LDFAPDVFAWGVEEVKFAENYFTRDNKGRCSG
jgi:hypothetical protein